MDVHRFTSGLRTLVLAGGGFAAVVSLLVAGPAAAQDKPIHVGLLGRKVELLMRDSQLKPELGTLHTRDTHARPAPQGHCRRSTASL